MEVEEPTKTNGVAEVKVVEMQTDKEKTSADYYFDSYAHYSIHEEMIKDNVRTNTYLKAILDNAHIFRGKTVLDVGCGTGILCLFCAKAGAEHVYGVDMSTIAQQAQQIVKDNKVESKVTILQGKMEDIVLPVEKVDIIVSEWMGYFLMYESMLPTVLYARDKYLRPGGLIFPDTAKLWVVGIEDADYKQEKIHFWDNVYGFDFSCIKKLALQEPLVDNVDQEQICTNQCMLKSFDLHTMTNEDVDFECTFSLRADRDDHIHALVAFFDVEFKASHKKPLGFTTSPRYRSTHWKQTVFYLDEVIVTCKGETLTGHLKSKRNGKNHRDLDINIQYDFDGQVSQIHAKQDFRMR